MVFFSFTKSSQYKSSLIGLDLFRHLMFRQETFQHGHLITGTFRLEDILAKNIWTKVFFGIIDGLHGKLGHWNNILAQGYFGTWTYQHRAPMPKCLCRNVYIDLQGVKMYMIQNVHVLKYLCAEISQCSAIMSLRQNVYGAKIYLCQNVVVPKCPCLKSPCDEMSMPKCQGPK